MKYQSNIIGTLILGELTIKVYVLKRRTVYSRIDYLVTPVEGDNWQWFSEQKIKLDSPETAFFDGMNQAQGYADEIGRR